MLHIKRKEGEKVCIDYNNRSGEPDLIILMRETASDYAVVHVYEGALKKEFELLEGEEVFIREEGGKAYMSMSKMSDRPNKMVLSRVSEGSANVSFDADAKYKIDRDEVRHKRM